MVSLGFWLIGGEIFKMPIGLTLGHNVRYHTQTTTQTTQGSSQSHKKGQFVKLPQVHSAKVVQQQYLQRK